jgi:hypothetical protein
LNRKREKEMSMSLKFAAVGSFTVLSPFGLPARAGDRVRNFGSSEAHDPLLAMLGVAIKAEQPKTSEAGERDAERDRS